MTPESWAQIEPLYHEARALPADERAAFLAKACAGDQSMLREIETLLAADAEAGSFIAHPAIHQEAGHLLADAQTMQIGQRISHYQIVSQIGEGGMGQVWLAEDKNLGRQVAIKLLPAEFTGNADRLRRFEQEARAASALNHPNIVTVHEIGEVDGLHFLVTEFVKGRTLRQALANGPMPVSQALDVAEQIAEALAAAHGAGIIHRDIKPENVMVRHDGYVKVLDFGLAKLTAPVGMNSDSLSRMDTLRAANTTPGMILGTPRYMSPEQARGLSLDSRTDLFSLGVVLYELLAGNPPFAGETLSDLIASILMTTPTPLSEVAPNTPPELQTIVGKLLEKKPEQRYRTAEDLLADLQDCKTDLQVSARLERRHQSQSQQTAILPTTNPPRPVWKHPKVWLASLALLTVFGAGGWWLTTRKNETPAATTIWPVKTLVNWRLSPSEGVSDCRFSPNGEFIAFSVVRNGRRQIHLNQTGEKNSLPVTDDEWNNFNPIWSPDGRDLAFISERDKQQSIWRMRALGGTQTLVAQLHHPGARLRDWSADGATIYFESNSQLFAVDVATGNTREITLPEPTDPNVRNLDFRLAPDGKKFVFIKRRNSQDDLWIRNTEGSAPIRITADSLNKNSPVWHPDGQRIVYSARRDGVRQIFAVGLQDKQPQQLTFGESDYSVADVVKTDVGVRILCSANRSEADLWRVKVATGEEEQLTSDLNFDLWPSLSPDGRTLAYKSIILREPTQLTTISKTVLVAQSLSEENKPRQLASDMFRYAWSPDGKQIAFTRNADGLTNLWTVSVSGDKERQITTGGVEYSPYQVFPHQGVQVQDFSWSRNNHEIAYVRREKTETQLRVATVDGSSDTVLHTASPNEEFICPIWSPDGQRLVFASKTANSPEPGQSRWGIWLAEPSSGHTELIFQSEFAVRLLGWSESGQDVWFAFNNGRIARDGSSQQIQAALLSLKQRQPIKTLSLPAARLFNTHLSPSGRFIAFTADQNERDSLWIIPVNGGAARKLVDGRETRVYFSSLAWSPDERNIYYGKQVNWQLISMIDRFQ
ncbi:MAG: PD40 domain-containing protein [Acidobacteria bacterium]|nr:PD40 domain-containing protein [Acidobacteriota bacterium]